MINNRQAGRRRGRGNGQRQGGNPGRPDNGNRIDSRARGNANQLYEKYKNLASDAQRQGDRVNTEYYLQFADHYFRVLNENRSRFEEQGQRRQRDDNFVNGFDTDFDGDEDFGDEGESVRAGEQGGDDAPRGEGSARNNGRGDGRRDEPRREARRERDGSNDRDGTNERGGGRDRDGSRRGDRRPAVANDGNGDSGLNNTDVAADHQAELPHVAHDMVAAGDEAASAEPRRRGRPRRERIADAGDVVPAAIDADRLPPALSAGNDVDVSVEDSPKPRRRRTRVAEGGEAPSAG